MTDNSKIVFNFVKGLNGEGMTATDIAEATGLGVKSVNGIVTALARHQGVVERVEKTVDLGDGKTKSVKFIYLTEKGQSFDPDAVEEKAE